MQKAVDCGVLTPDPVPPSVFAQLKVLPAEPELRSPDQVALNDWMNHATTQAEKRRTYCNPA